MNNSPIVNTLFRLVIELTRDTRLGFSARAFPLVDARHVPDPCARRATRLASDTTHSDPSQQRRGMFAVLL